MYHTNRSTIGPVWQQLAEFLDGKAVGSLRPSVKNLAHSGDRPEGSKHSAESGKLAIIDRHFQFRSRSRIAPARQSATATTPLTA